MSFKIFKMCLSLLFMLVCAAPATANPGTGTGTGLNPAETSGGTQPVNVTRP